MLVRGGLILVGLAGAACGEELTAALRGRLLDPFGNQIVKIAGDTAPGTVIDLSSDRGGGGSSFTFDQSSSTLPLVCEGTCPTTVAGKPLPFAVTQVASQGVQLCVPAPAVVNADGSVTTTSSVVGSVSFPVFTPGDSPVKCDATPSLKTPQAPPSPPGQQVQGQQVQGQQNTPSSASAVSPVIMAIVGVLLSMLL